jgi:hypothetical protein
MNNNNNNNNNVPLLRIRPIGLYQFRIISEIMNHRQTVGLLGRVISNNDDNDNDNNNSNNNNNNNNNKADRIQREEKEKIDSMNWMPIKTTETTSFLSKTHN